ncbi:MAG: hypothetical protein R3E86_02925 [Pseudomonadales bacterium]
MSEAVEEAASRLRGEVAFDLLLGGVNTHATQPVGDYGRRLLLHIWREVHATTGARFGFRVPDGIVYNSTLPCLAVLAVRQALGRPPFGYLHRLQQLFFQEGCNVNDLEVLCRTATEFEVAAGHVRRAVSDADLLAKLQAEFDSARVYGTSALPSVLVEVSGERSLLAGGYLDADMLVALVRERQASKN